MGLGVAEQLRAAGHDAAQHIPFLQVGGPIVSLGVSGGVERLKKLDCLDQIRGVIRVRAAGVQKAGIAKALLHQNRFCDLGCINQPLGGQVFPGLTQTAVSDPFRDPLVFSPVVNQRAEVHGVKAFDGESLGGGREVSSRMAGGVDRS